MDIKFLFYSWILFLVIVYANGNKEKKEKGKCKEKDIEEDAVKEVSALQPTQPQYINQFSQSLKFLSTFFHVLQRQLDTTIDTFNPQKPNPILSALLANPNLIPFALRRLRDPLKEMITITDKIELILLNNPIRVENNQELLKLLQQLQRRLQSTFGIIMPNTELTRRIPTSFPEAIESISNTINQFASMFAVFSQSVKDYANGPTIPTTKPLPVLNQMAADGNTKSALALQVDDVCSRLQTMHILSLMTNSSEPTIRQGGGGMGSILNGFLNGLMSLLSSLFGLSSEATLGMLVNLLASLNQAVPHGSSRPTTTTTKNDSQLVTELFANMSFGNNIEAILPFTSRQWTDFHQMTFGVINNKNRLVVTNIVTKDIDNNHTSIGDKRQFANQLNQFSLEALLSMMTSLVSQMKDSNGPEYTTVLQVSPFEPKPCLIGESALQCQLQGLGCSLRNNGQFSEVQKCLKTLSSCIGTGL